MRKSTFLVLLLKMWTYVDLVEAMSRRVTRGVSKQAEEDQRTQSRLRQDNDS